MAASRMLSHPVNCLGFPITFDGKSVCFVIDNELYTAEPGFQNEPYEKNSSISPNALKILITDPTCFDDEYPKKTHWGHPPVGRVVEIATAVKVKALHLF
ncbi:MAG: hypothetical protein P8L66_08260, partial [Rhodospirillaceae bacterium]|nr:hypothetical protein [Rhodospirillaceae bacterium]